MDSEYQSKKSPSEGHLWSFVSQLFLNAAQRQLIVESHSQDVKQTHVGLVKRPEQQQREKIRNSLQIRDTNTPFLHIPASLSVCLRLLTALSRLKSVW